MDNIDRLRRESALPLIFLFIALLLVACTATPQQSTPTLPTESTQTPAGATTPAYPDPTDAGGGNVAPTAAAYPGAQSPAPTVDAYPGGLVWVIRPAGIQCETETAPGYGSLNEAVATLSAAGINVFASETIELQVTTVCGSPTSEHYRVQIGADQLATVEGMGWTAEN
jgi:hypothetical protein